MEQQTLDPQTERSELKGKDLLEFFETERERGVTVTAIARRMSISRQGLYQRLDAARAAHDAA